MNEQIIFQKMILFCTVQLLTNIFVSWPMLLFFSLLLAHGHKNLTTYCMNDGRYTCRQCQCTETSVFPFWFLSVRLQRVRGRKKYICVCICVEWDMFYVCICYWCRNTVKETNGRRQICFFIFISRCDFPVSAFYSHLDPCVHFLLFRSLTKMSFVCFLSSSVSFSHTHVRYQ